MKKTLIYFCILFSISDIVAQDFTLTWEPEPKKLKDFDLENKVRIISQSPYFGKDLSLGKSQMKASKDLSKVLYVVNTNKKEKNENVRLQYTVKDTLGNIIQKGLEIELPYTNKYFEMMEIFISNDNVIYLCAAIEQPAKLIRRTVNFDFDLKVFRIVEKKVDEFLINQDGKYIGDCKLSLGWDNKLRGFGLYSNDDKGGMLDFHRFVHGYFAFEIERSSKNLNLKFLNALTDEQIEKISGKYALKMKMGIGDTFIIRNIWYRADGGFSVILESLVTFRYTHKGYSMEKNSPQDVGGQRYVRNHYYDHTTVSNMYWDLIIWNFDSTGKLIFTTHIPKRQKDAEGNQLASIYATYYNDKIYILFNDHVKNVVNGNFKERMNGPEIAQPVLLKIDSDGTYTKKPLTNKSQTKKSSDSGVKMNIVFTERVSDNEAIVFDYGIKNKVRIGHLTIH